VAALAATPVARAEGHGGGAIFIRDLKSSISNFKFGFQIRSIAADAFFDHAQPAPLTTSRRRAYNAAGSDFGAATTTRR
jgi:hypothetical protein